MNYMDEHLFLCIREGVTFYYFGNGCIADYYGQSIDYLQDDDISLIKLCDGSHMVFECVELFHNINKRGSVIQRITALRRSGILVLKDHARNTPPVFFGEKGLFYPKEMAIELTSCCNYCCPFCYKDAKKTGNFITDTIMDNIIETIKSNVSHITFTGGEPTLHPHLIKYIDQFSEKIPFLTMITNGSLLYTLSPYASSLKKIDIIQFSIYGRNDEEYAEMTRNKKGFTYLQKSIELAHNLGIRVHLALTLSEQTIPNLEAFVDVAKTLKPEGLLIGFAENFGRGQNVLLGDDLIKSVTRNIDILRRVNRNELKIFKSYQSKTHGFNRDDKELREKAFRGAFSCGAGSQELVVSSRGRIRPCHFLPEEYFSIPSENALIEHINGNFHTDYLKESWTNYLKTRKTVMSDLCEGL